MIEIQLKKLTGTLVWSSNDAPLNLISEPMPLGIAHALGISSTIREYSLSSLKEYSCVQSMSHHGRSYYLGNAESWHYFSKGGGWTLGSGWSPEHGNTGILPLWAALRERDISLKLNSLGIAVSLPVAIWELSSIVGPDNNLVPSSQVIDLDGTPARPCVFVYQSQQRWRLADLPYVQPTFKVQLKNNFWKIINRLKDSVKKLHDNGGHDYSISLHNVWVDGSRVDFEYVYLPNQPHPVMALNANINQWQSKEKQSLYELIYQLAELCNYEIDPADMIQARNEIALGLME
jgi:hypothetical protein